MAKEQVRKRGRRKPKQEGEAPPKSRLPALQPESVGVGTLGLHPSRAALISSRPPPVYKTDESRAVDETTTLEWQRGPRTDSETPFGVLDPDLKAYFRNVENQIRDWEGAPSIGEEREDRQQFLDSVLKELRGFELQVATDPDCAIVLERLLPSLGDWGRRVIGDAVGDGWEQLVRHRFGSHVAQTWFSLGADTLDRETRGVYPSQHHAQVSSSTEVGVLPTMTTLVSGIITSLLPTLPTLLNNAHASPPLRLLLLVLTPGRSLPSLDGMGYGSLVRSKKSDRFRKGQRVQGKSILGDDGGKGKEKVVERVIPHELLEMRRTLRTALMGKLSEQEWRVMGVDAVGSAAVQLLLELEVEQGEAGDEGSLLDHLTQGLVSHLKVSPTSPANPQEYLNSLIANPTGTHLFEAILLHSPFPIFNVIWCTYFRGKISKLALHPYANFVVARGVSRLDRDGIQNVVAECASLSGGQGFIKTARTSVLQALVDRAAVLDDCRMSVLELFISALGLPSDRSSLVPCLMTLKTFPSYHALLTGAETPVEPGGIPAEAVDQDAEDTAAAASRMEGWKNRRRQKRDDSGLGPNMQGCLLLQALVRLPGANEVVLQSLLSQDKVTLIGYAQNPIASHFLDAALTSPSVPMKYRRRLISSFLGNYSLLAQDRLGSRVSDTIWAVSDGYMREKIARSLIPDAALLGASEYGRFFVRKLNLWGLERRPDEWRQAQLGVKASPGRTGGQIQAVKGGIGDQEDDLKEVESGDAIDQLFATVHSTKRRKI
ncbi:MAG: Nucleolar protein 9 [Tremellales sp. Tagirdzhanova-0007]|nr:MAG: Nucleolar protein 9 [Tremellales sp. Tagirdzhanova-0007]